MFIDNHEDLLRLLPTPNGRCLCLITTGMGSTIWLREFATAKLAVDVLSAGETIPVDVGVEAASRLNSGFCFNTNRFTSPEIDSNFAISRYDRRR